MKDGSFKVARSDKGGEREDELKGRAGSKQEARVIVVLIQAGDIKWR
jgi:hypothetical protein